MEFTMTRTIGFLMISAGLALPLSATAQQGDPAYCSALAQQYHRYVGDSSSSRRSQQRDVNVDTAITQCPSNSVAAIPVLEKALKDAKVDLPPRT
jgi:hypothetical protein